VPVSHESTNGDLHEEPVLVSTTDNLEESSARRASQLVPRRRRGIANQPVQEESSAVVEQSPQDARSSIPASQPIQSTSWSIPSSVSWETLAYVVLVLLAIGTRFWNLGEKALHHDESLHAYYSWVYSVGDGYRHDPLMHGPFLFHFNALIYLLFGDSDATSRYGPAFFGVLMVALPWLLRGPRFLGKYGALAASFFILISPSILYQSRYIRHDIYTIGGTLFLFICIFRYLETPRRAWLIAGSATLAFLFTNHEIVFAIAAIFFLFLYAAVMIEQFTAFRRTGDRRAWELAGVHAGYLVLMLLLYALVPASRKHELMEIPWENPTRAQENAYYRMFLSNPLIIGAIVLTVLFLVGLWWTLGRDRPQAMIETENEDGEEIAAVVPAGGRIYFTPADGFSVTGAVRAAWDDRNGLLMALGAYLLVFVPLYTSMFTNMAGLRSSTIDTDGTLLYWLGQHDYRRGEQPWFYFLLLLPQYEYIAATLGAILMVVTFVRAGAALLGWSGGRQLFFRLFLSIWFLLIFAGLSYAGEKMPWLLVHISLPGCLLAAALVGGLVDMAAAKRASGTESNREWSWFGLSLRDWGFATALVLIGGAFVWIAAPLTYGQFIQTDDGSHAGIRRYVTENAADHWWWLAIPFLLASVAIVGWIVWRGIQRTSFAVLSALLVGLALMQVHAGWRLSMHDADVPKDMLIYTQTSPDVTRVMNEIGALSEELTGGEHLEVWYDSGVSWPFQWYLRNYDNARFIGASLSQDPGNAPVLLLGGNSDLSSQYLANYTATNYVLRWWFPEETYRGFAIAPEIPVGRSAWQSADQAHGPFDILRSVFDTVDGEQNIDNQLRLYRLLMYRDLDWEIGQTPFRLYIRNDLLPLYNSIRYSQ
jgi:predicted membrane-bound mannosyltransferase